MHEVLFIRHLAILSLGLSVFPMAALLGGHAFVKQAKMSRELVQIEKLMEERRLKRQKRDEPEKFATEVDQNELF